MASLYRQRYTKKIPAGAEILTVNGVKKVKITGKGDRVKIYDCVTGRDGKPRLAGYSNTWNISYHDIDGIRRNQSTGCCDKSAARQMLAKIEQQIEQVKSGMMSKRDLKMIEHRDAPIELHFDDYMEHLEVKTIRGRAISHRHKIGIRQRLRQMIDECGIGTLEDISGEIVEKWMLDAKRNGRSPRTINCYRSALVSFCNCGPYNIKGYPATRLAVCSRQTNRRIFVTRGGRSRRMKSIACLKSLNFARLQNSAGP